MAIYSFRRVALEGGIETSRGGGPGALTTKFLFPHASVSFSDQVDKIKLSASLGDKAMNRGELLEEKWAEGSIECELREDSFGLILLNALGTVSSSTASGVTTHSYSLEETDQTDSIYLKLIDPTKGIMFKNVMLSNVQINVTMGDVVKFTAEFMGKYSVTSTTTALTRIDENNFTKNHAKIKIASDVGSLSGASRLPIKDYTLTFDKGSIEKDSSLGTAEPEDFLNTSGVSITGSFNLNYEDETYKDYVFDNTVRAMKFQLLNDDVTIGSSGNPELDIEFSNVYFDQWEPANELDESRKQTINFEAHWDEVNEKYWDTFDLKNEQGDYTS